MIATELCMPQWSPFFEGHFEGAPILSGVAQLALVEHLLLRAPQPNSLQRIERVRFKQSVGPGSALRIEISEPSESGQVRFSVRSNDAVISEGVLRVR